MLRLLISNEKQFRDIFFCASEWAWEVDTEGRYTYCSEHVKDLFGYSVNEIIGKTPFDLMPPDEANRIKKTFEKIVAQKEPIVDLENWNLCHDNKKICLLTNGFPIFDTNGNFYGYRGKDRDITIFKQLKNELIDKIQAFDELNIAFKILIREKNDDKKELEHNIISNLKEMVFPFIEKLKNSNLSEQQRNHLEIIKSNLDNISAPFIQKISSKYYGLTPTETKIACLIKDGKTTKEIASCLDASLNSIKFHRYNIRKKLDIKNKSNNLRLYLQSIS